MHPREVDGVTVLNAVAVWFAPSDPAGIIAYRTDDGEWYGTGGGPHPTMREAIHHALSAQDTRFASEDERAEKLVRAERAVAQQAARIREVEGDLDARLTENATLRADLATWKRRAERARVFGAVLAVLALVAGFVVGGAL
jgi:hypothetical protein